jgi:outer membrane protein assembly factor BamB
MYDTPAIRHQPEVKWKTNVSTTWLMPPLVADGILFTGSGDGVLYALNAETGEKMWSQGGFEAFESTGAAAEEVFVAAGYSRVVKALNKKTGEELWSYRTDYAIQGAPLIVEDRVYVATDHTVYALDLNSGQLRWKAVTGTEDAYMGGPAYDHGVIYTTGGKLLLALEAATGKEIWRVRKDENFLGLAVANGYVYVGNWDQNLYAFDQSDGKEIWKFPARSGGVFWSAPAVDDDTVYAGNIDRFLYALDAKTGELRWSFDTHGDSVSEALVSDGVLYVSDSSHAFPRGARHLYALDAATGEQIWVFETIGTFLPAPELANDTIYLTSTGDVIALK